MDAPKRFDLYLLPPDDNAQTLGALFTLKERIDRLVILSDGDDEEARRLDRLARALKKFAKKEGLRWRVLRQNFTSTTVPPTPPKGTPVALLAAATEASTLLRYTAKLDASTPLYGYDAWDDRLFLHRGDRCEPIPTKKLKLLDYCQMLGYEILQTKAIGDPDRFEAIETLYRHESNFLAARKALLAHGRLEDKGRGEVERALRRLGIVDGRGALLRDALPSLQGGLFEEYLHALCLQEGFDDALLGCTIDFTPSIADPHAHVVNEFDILLIRDNRVATVECKYVHRLDGLAFVYKYDAVVDYFGQTARALIVNVTHRARHPRLRGENFTDAVLRRSLLGNVRVYSDIRFDRAKFLNALEWLKR